MDITPQVLVDIHRRMVRIRIFEEEAGKLQESACVPAPAASSTATAISPVAAFQPVAAPAIQVPKHVLDVPRLPAAGGHH